MLANTWQCHSHSSDCMKNGISCFPVACDTHDHNGARLRSNKTEMAILSSEALAVLIKLYYQVTVRLH